MGRFERSREIDRDRTVLDRIVALLLALAGLADRAAGSSAHARRQVLDILAHGEAEARGMIVAIVSGPKSRPESDNGPAEVMIPDFCGQDFCSKTGDALLLAARLRALALVLTTMLSAARALPGRTGPRMSPPSQKFARSPSGWQGLRAPPPPDTS